MQHKYLRIRLRERVGELPRALKHFALSVWAIHYIVALSHGFDFSFSPGPVFNKISVGDPLNRVARRAYFLVDLKSMATS
jgi:hypothetical protein